MSLYRPANNLRIALILSELRPGGMERVVVHLANGLVEADATVLVVCLQGAGLLAEELDAGRMRLVALESYKSFDLNAVGVLRRELRQFQPDVINVHDYASLPYAIAANFPGRVTPVLFTAHGLLYQGFENLVRRNRLLARWVKALAAVSIEVANRHRDYLAWRAPVEVIANGVPKPATVTVERKQVRRDLGCSDDDFLFLAVGNPRPEKAFEDLIEAVRMLELKQITVVVAGVMNDSNYCQMLQNLVQQDARAQSCRFVGFREDTANLYAAADAFVLSSRSEGLPMVILEAMMAGLPVVSTRVGGIPDAVGENVLLVDPKAPRQLAEAMQKIVLDVSFRKRVASQGQRHIDQNFGLKRMVGDYINWYQASQLPRSVNS